MENKKSVLESLLEIINNVASGDYSNDIMALTTDDTPEPVRTIAEAMGMMMVKIEAREYQLELLIEELRGLNEQIKENSLQTVAAMVQALEARDAYTRGHADRVATLAAETAMEMGMDKKAVEVVRTAGVLHDIGKIGCSDKIFQPHDAKSSPDMVREIISHPGMGATILKRLDFLGEVREIIHAHHERVDGKGYPKGLSGDAIPRGALIIAVADAFDAMTTDRPYQKAKTREHALQILREFSGKSWHPDCVSAFERLQLRKAASASTGDQSG
ncbi:MAG: HD domain-containing phosphohydrolase [Candidatus Ozemobacteraceae bacterium]